MPRGIQKGLTARVIALATNRLLEEGFEKGSDRMLTYPVCKGFRGTVYLSALTNHGLGLAPIVGLRSDELQEFYCQITNEKNRPDRTSVSPGSDIFPEAYCWWFSPADPKPIIDNMCRVIRKHGIPFMNENASLLRICRLLKKYDTGAEKYAVALFLLGKEEKAKAAIIARACHDWHEWAVDKSMSFKKFFAQQCEFQKKFLGKCHGPSAIRELELALRRTPTVKTEVDFALEREMERMTGKYVMVGKKWKKVSNEA